MSFKLSKSNKSVFGEITLNGSKSISNRALIIRALSGSHFKINNLSNSRDTVLLQDLLHSDETTLDAEAAGTTFRFLTAYHALGNRTVVLTGSPRMKNRPIGILVDVLNQIGANITYMEKPGYPPLKIEPAKGIGSENRVQIASGTSSQYISALLMIAPSLPNGLILELSGETVSKPYINMTLDLMGYFGIEYTWDKDSIYVAPQRYDSVDIDIEADWSAASYFYSIASLADECEIKLNGLFEKSVQGDSVLVSMMTNFGVSTEFQKGSIIIRKSENAAKSVLEWDFLPCPDLAQTIAVLCAAKGIHGLFTGLQTLKIKETDRIEALKNELAKTGVSMAKLPPKFNKKSTEGHYLVEGKAILPDNVTFQTYEDHRMAMAFAPLAILGEIIIEHPNVVEKSYPAFWDDLKKLGFGIESI